MGKRAEWANITRDKRFLLPEYLFHTLPSVHVCKKIKREEDIPALIQKESFLFLNAISDILAHASLWDDKTLGKSAFYNDVAY